MSNMSGKPPSYSYSYSTSKSSTSTTSNKNRKPQTYMETVTSSSANGEPTKLQYNDNFEELKRSVLSGDAYKKKVGDITARPGLPHYKPQSGLTVIRPVRSEALQTTARQYHPVGRERSLIMDGNWPIYAQLGSDPTSMLLYGAITVYMILIHPYTSKPRLDYTRLGALTLNILNKYPGAA